jgi:hypothetical protein
MVKGTSSSPSLKFTGRSLPVLLLTLGAGCSGHTATTTDPQVIASELREHVVWLASDELRGRRTGTPDAARAARYLAAEFRRYGLRPEGEEGKYLQDFPFVSGTTEEATPSRSFSPATASRSPMRAGTTTPA